MHGTMDFGRILFLFFFEVADGTELFFVRAIVDVVGGDAQYARHLKIFFQTPHFRPIPENGGFWKKIFKSRAYWESTPTTPKIIDKKKPRATGHLKKEQKQNPSKVHNTMHLHLATPSELF